MDNRFYYSCHRAIDSHPSHYTTRTDGSAIAFKQFPERKHYYWHGVHAKKETITMRNYHGHFKFKKDII